MTDPNLYRKVRLAQYGLEVGPDRLVHDEKGPGVLYMDANGIRFEPDDKAQEPVVKSWQDMRHKV